MMTSTPIITYTPRFCDNETIANKLIFQVRTGQLTPDDMDGLQDRCRTELHELRQELNTLLGELRAWLAPKQLPHENVEQASAA
ncbi:hypothetical protein [Paenibacillus sp. PL2-23]|uniref:hypothetical protein n=1 Tax=Paenibacillus sp. PL2-23 TaxID=2100729 RepID=UPI0030F5618C